MRTLDKILEDMNGLPNKYRSLEPFTAKKDLIKVYKKTSLMMRNMRNDTMKQKHWKILLQKINLKKGYNDL